MRSQCHTNLVRSDGSRVTLATIPPVNLHVIIPGRDTIVPPERVSQVRLRTGLEPRPSAHARIRTIRAHDPARLNTPSANLHTVKRNPGDCSPPEQIGTQLRGAFDHDSV